MKQVQGMIAIVMLALTVAAVAEEPAIQFTPRDTSKGPVLRLEPSSWDFGEVWYGTPLSQDVKLINVGSKPLEIKNIKKSCGCTLANLDDRTLDPGESTVMKVGYDSMKGRVDVKQTITIETNDTERPTTRFVLQGVCKNMFEFSIGDQNVKTPNLQLGQLSKSDVRSATLTIKRLYDKQKVHLKLVDEETPGLELKLKEVEAGEVYELTATTVPPLNAGSTMRVVYLETDVDFVKKVKIRVGGYVVPAVRVVPTELPVSPKLTFESKKRVKVVYQKTSPLKITKVECDDPRVKWTMLDSPVAASGPNASLGLDVTVPPGAEIPDDGITLTIITDSKDPDYQRLEIPIRKSVVRRPARKGAGAPATGADVRKLIETRAAEAKSKKDAAKPGKE